MDTATREKRALEPAAAVGAVEAVGTSAPPHPPQPTYPERPHTGFEPSEVAEGNALAPSLLNPPSTHTHAVRTDDPTLHHSSHPLPPAAAQQSQGGSTDASVGQAAPPVPVPAMQPDALALPNADATGSDAAAAAAAAAKGAGTAGAVEATAAGSVADLPAQRTPTNPVQGQVGAPSAPHASEALAASNQAALQEHQQHQGQQLISPPAKISQQQMPQQALLPDLTGLPMEEMYDDEEDLAMLGCGEPLGGHSQHANQVGAFVPAYMGHLVHLCSLPVLRPCV